MPKSVCSVSVCVHEGMMGMFAVSASGVSMSS